MAARIAVPTTAQLPANPKTSFLDLAIIMPEKVTAQFVLVPVRRADPVKAARGGVVAQVLASEGQIVNKMTFWSRCDQKRCKPN